MLTLRDSNMTQTSPQDLLRAIQRAIVQREYADAMMLLSEYRYHHAREACGEISVPCSDLANYLQATLERATR